MTDREDDRDLRACECIVGIKKKMCNVGRSHRVILNLEGKTF